MPSPVFLSTGPAQGTKVYLCKKIFLNSSRSSLSVNCPSEIFVSSAAKNSGEIPSSAKRSPKEGIQEVEVDFVVLLLESKRTQISSCVA